ncbi:hypothetical protein D3C72_1776930 [compost metagenome]
MVIGNAVPAGQGLQVRVVGHHRHHVHGQVADALAVEQVVEAMVGLAHHQHHLGPVTRRGQFGVHIERRQTLVEAGAERLLVEAVGLAELDADEEARGQPVIERMVFGDVAALLEQKARHRVHGTEHARAVAGENPGVGGAAHDRVLGSLRPCGARGRGFSRDGCSRLKPLPRVFIVRP